MPGGLVAGAPSPGQEDPQEEVPLGAPVEGGGNDGVLPRFHRELDAHLPSVHIAISLTHWILILYALFYIYP